MRRTSRWVEIKIKIIIIIIVIEKVPAPGLVKPAITNPFFYLSFYLATSNVIPGSKMPLTVLDRRLLFEARYPADTFRRIPVRISGHGYRGRPTSPSLSRILSSPSKVLVVPSKKEANWRCSDRRV